jgi:serine/threonine-protein kinase HipA
MNPDPHGAGLKLNISETDNAQDLDLALSVAPAFRLKSKDAQAIVREVGAAVKQWRVVATHRGLSRAAQARIQHAFRVAEETA